MTGPREWAEISRFSFNNTDETINLQYYNTQLVVRGPKHNPQFGPEPFPPTRGNLSTAVQNFMLDGNPEMWPEWDAEAINQQVCRAALLCSKLN